MNDVSAHPETLAIHFGAPDTSIDAPVSSPLVAATSQDRVRLEWFAITPARMRSRDVDRARLNS